MSKIYSLQERPKSKPSVTGNGKEPEYSYEINEKGVRTLKRTGEVDVYAQIQTYLEETKIENIIQRATYDPTAIGSQEWMTQEEVDISNVPENYHEWKRMVNDAENRFNALPAELKEKFGNSVEQYISEMGTVNWAKKLGWTEPIEPIERKEEINSEQKQ
ncbi:VP3 [Gokushovirinae sp.]|nr:VP3 [Gokushovirinae sp.]